MAAQIALLWVLRQPWPHHLCLFLFIGFFRCLSLHDSPLVGLQLHFGVRSKLVPRACAPGHLCNHFSKIDVKTSGVNLPCQCPLEYPNLPAQDPNNALATVQSSSCCGSEPRNQRESHTSPAGSSWTSLLVCFQSDPRKNVCI